jgi:hypothetical protein
MQKRFTAMVPQSVLTKLGWGNPATWAEVFDFLSDKGMLVSISRSYDFGEECFVDGYEWSVDCENTLRSGLSGDSIRWEKAAEDAVMKCLEILS